MDLNHLNITPTKEKQFNKKGIFTVEDLLRFIPIHYCDYRKPISLEDCIFEPKMGAVVGILQQVKKYDKNGKKIIIAEVTDSMSRFTLKITWFQSAYMEKMARNLTGRKVIVCNTIKYNQVYKNFETINPIVFSEFSEQYLRIMPVYSKIAGMSTTYLLERISEALYLADTDDPYTDELRKEFQLVSVEELYQYLHHPKTPSDVSKAHKRLVFEKLYCLATVLEKENSIENMTSGYIIKTLANTNKFLNSLPYKLTADQQETLSAMVDKAKKGQRINSLVQGDVGCGKTIVAFTMMFSMADNGYQSVLMAPTGVLAEQHYKELKEYAEKHSYKAVYLGSNMKASERKKALKGIEDGTYNFVVGTHSVINKDVKFKALGMAVIDEEHRFGVNQRNGAIKEGNCHVITMSATPIPRSLALTIYGKATDVYTIKTMPNGRKPVKTKIFNKEQGIFKFMQNQIAEGRQCYIVCPLKEENEKLENVESVEEVYQKVNNYFKDSGIRTEMLVGGMSKEDTDSILSEFTKNNVQILIATTIVEVGVNVPNASVILIRNAERFGLATLHQLRGRVGRGSYQSYCILQSDDEANPRLNAMVQTTDGFEIAQIDLNLRGSGDFIGTKQSGENREVMLMLQYPEFYKKIEKYVEQEQSRKATLNFEGE